MGFRPHDAERRRLDEVRHGMRRHPRRRREGAVLAPRRAAVARLSADALQISAKPVFLRAAGRGKLAAQSRRKRVRAPRYRGVRGWRRCGARGRRRSARPGTSTGWGRRSHGPFGSGWCAASRSCRLSPVSTLPSRPDAPRRTASLPRCRKTSRPRTAAWCSVRRSPGWSGTSSSTAWMSIAGCAAIRLSRRPRRRAGADATMIGAISAPKTSSRCRTSGNIPGSPPGISPSIASPSP